MPWNRLLLALEAVQDAERAVQLATKPAELAEAELRKFDAALEEGRAKELCGVTLLVLLRHAIAEYPAAVLARLDDLLPKSVAVADAIRAAVDPLRHRLDWVVGELRRVQDSWAVDRAEYKRLDDCFDSLAHELERASQPART